MPWEVAGRADSYETTDGSLGRLMSPPYTSAHDIPIQQTTYGSAHSFVRCSHRSDLRETTHLMAVTSLAKALRFFQEDQFLEFSWSKRPVMIAILALRLLSQTALPSSCFVKLAKPRLK